MSNAPTQNDSPSNKHPWRFFRAGGVDQVRLQSGADLLAIANLDQKLWVALACPVKGLEFDAQTLALIDGDKDGRVRAPEVIAAIKWTAARLKDMNELTKGTDGLPLSSINDTTPEGRQLVASARHILSGLGKADAGVVTVADTTETAKIFAQMKFNGDGVLPPESVDDPAAKAVAADIIACLGGETDRGGSPGITQAKLDQFFADLQAYADWWKATETGAATVLPLGDQTPAAYDAVQAVKGKVDDYFARCRLAAYDPRALTAVNRQEDEYLAVVAKDMSITAQEVAGFPLARVEAGRAIPLKDGVNPAWADALGKLRDLAVQPILGQARTELTEQDWADMNAKLAPFAAWCACKAGASVEPLGRPRIAEILAGNSKETLTALIAQDKALEEELSAITTVERLARFYRDLYQLLNNFVSFTDFYSRRRKAVFQAGTLYLDGRSCELCVRVDDMGKHGALAGFSKTFLAYCDCSRPGTSEKMSIAAAFTGGDSDQLMVGRNGIFYDRNGRDWDATVVKIIENPISIRQAFWMPYKRALRWIEEMVAKRAAVADAAASDKLTAAATTTVDAAKTGKPPEVKPKFDVGVVAALGVAVGGITAALGALLQAFFGLGIWMPLGLIAMVLLISGPSMLIAWLKLRQRNLGPILDANGWAVNGRVKINVPFGSALTSIASLPAGAQRSLEDPYAQEKSVWPKVVLVLVILALAGFALHKGGFLPCHAKKSPAPIAETVAPPPAAK